MVELPPRARRIRRPWYCLGTILGTTSACAENTIRGDGDEDYAVNYLRVRGEYFCTAPSWHGRSELPPRARRIRRRWINTYNRLGTTSACAENTRSVMLSCWNNWNYLRVRGEYWSVTYPDGASLELPPRARRLRAFTQLRQGVFGTTSACAENTTQCLTMWTSQRNYLRVRGEYPK